jgi:hypothetical protein
MVRWPEWWSWEIELSPHLLKRMADRRFNEADLRAMLADASGYREDIEESRWLIHTRHGGQAWEIIAEPIVDENVLVIVTAYPVER